MKKVEPETQPKIVPTPVCLPPALIKALDAQAAQEGLLRGRSAIVRRACAEYLHRHGRKDSETPILAEQEAA